MAITLVEYKKKRSGTRYHEEKKCYIGYRIDVWVNNVRYRNKRFPTRDAAEKYIDTLKLKNIYAKKGIKYNEPLKIPRVSEVFEKRLDKIENKADKVRARRVFQTFEKVIESDLKITDVGTLHFRKFNAKRIEDRVKPETVNRELNVLGPVFNTASEIFPEVLEDYRPPRIPRLKVKRSSKRTRVITEREKNLICDYLRQPKNNLETQMEFENRTRIGRMFEIAWLLGLRFREIARLKKKDFNFQEKTLKVTRYKTNSWTLFEYIPDFICMKIKEAIESSRNDFIYTISGNYPKDFYKILREAVEQNGMIYGREHQDGITFHSNRHSFTTRLIQNTDLATAQNFTGLSTKELLGYYGHATNESKKAAFENLYQKEQRQIGLQEFRQIYDDIQNRNLSYEEFLEIFLSSKTSVVVKNQTQKLRLVK